MSGDYRDGLRAKLNAYMGINELGEEQQPVDIEAVVKGMRTLEADIEVQQRAVDAERAQDLKELEQARDKELANARDDGFREQAQRNYLKGTLALKMAEPNRDSVRKLREMRRKYADLDAQRIRWETENRDAIEVERRTKVGETARRLGLID